VVYDFHTHSILSDGELSPVELIRRAIVNDYKAILYSPTNLDKENTTFIPNGEIGKIVEIVGNALVVDFDGTKIYCPKGTMGNIKLAYAISTHKSQGGQFKVVILVTPKAHTYMLNSNLLYVGETRAKEKCYHIAEVKTVNNALKKKENFDRNTFLGDILKVQTE
jgi:exodeoxyribonuclease V alpha subunit